MVGGKGRPTVKCRDTLCWAVQKWSNRSRCCLGCELGWAQGIVLDGGPAVLMDIAMATNFGTQLAITGFVGYNFGCMIGMTHCLTLQEAKLWTKIQWHLFSGHSVDVTLKLSLESILYKFHIMTLNKVKWDPTPNHKNLTLECWTLLLVKFSIQTAEG